MTVTSESRRPSHSQRPEPLKLDSPLERGLLNAVDVGLAAIMLLCPLFMGGRSPLGKLVFISVIGLVCLLWFGFLACRRQATWRWSGLEWVFLVGFALLTLQLVSLPEPWLQRISPAISELIPLVTQGKAADFGVRGWNQVSLNPSATVQATTVFVAYMLLFVVVYQRLNSFEDVTRLLKLVAVGVILMAIIGITQRAFSNGKFLWIYANPQRTTNDVVKGTFFNQNHFAHCMALGMGPLLWWMALVWNRAKRQSERQRRATLNQLGLLALGTGVVLLAGVLTVSRGGFAALGVVTLSAVVILAIFGLIDRRAVVVAGCTTVAVAVAVFVVGWEHFAQRIARVTGAASIEQVIDDSGRGAIWQASSLATAKFPILGAGGGSFSDVYQIFMSRHLNRHYEYADNSYLQLGVEFGWPGVLLVVATIVLFGRRCWQLLCARHEPEMRACSVALVGGLLVTTLHSAIDLVWYIPACMTITIFFAAILCRLTAWSRESATIEQADDDAVVEMPKVVCIACALAMAVSFVSLVKLRIPSVLAKAAWDQYERVNFEYQRANHVDESEFDESRQEQLALLEKVVHYDPANTRAHFILANLNILKFNYVQSQSEAPFSLTRIRNTALDSFADKESQLEWLNRACGPEQLQVLDKIHFHVGRAIQGSPLSGLAYLSASQIHFYSSPGVRSEKMWVNQAGRLRPTFGPVRLNALREMALVGQNDAANWYRPFFDLATKIYRENVSYRGPVAKIVLAYKLVQHTMPYAAQRKHLISFIKATQGPDQDEHGLTILFNTARRQKMQYATRVIGDHYLVKLKLLAERAKVNRAKKLWLEGCDVALYVRRLDLALAFSKSVLNLDQSNYQAHQTAALALTGMGRAAEAAKEIAWCNKLRPQDEQLKQRLKTMRRELLHARRLNPNRRQ